MPSYTVQAPAGTDTDGGAKRTFDTIAANTTLDATVLQVRDFIAPFKDKETGEPVTRIEFTFAITYDGQERRAWGETSDAFAAHPDCKQWWWAQEILGHELPEGTNFDTDMLQGKPCRIVLGVRTYQKDGVTHEKNFVKDVMRSRSTEPTTTSSAKTAGYEDPF